jgi:hypothetical protein
MFRLNSPLTLSLVRGDSEGSASRKGVLWSHDDNLLKEIAQQADKAGAEAIIKFHEWPAPWPWTPYPVGRSPRAATLPLLFVIRKAG